MLKFGRIKIKIPYPLFIVRFLITLPFNKCTNCGKSVDVRMVQCRHCEHPVTVEYIREIRERRENILSVVIFSTILIIFGLFVARYLYISGIKRGLSNPANVLSGKKGEIIKACRIKIQNISEFEVDMPLTHVEIKEKQVYNIKKIIVNQYATFYNEANNSYIGLLCTCENIKGESTVKLIGCRGATKNAISGR